MLHPILFFGLWALAATAQPPSAVPYLIHGSVVDRDTGQPVEGVRVVLYPTSRIFRSSDDLIPDKETRTDPGGGFSFPIESPKSFIIRAFKLGYTMAEPPGKPSILKTVSVTSNVTEMEVTLEVVREARIAGRVLEEETGRPLSGLTVSAEIASFREGRRVLIPSGARTQTGRDGRFALSPVTPGEYLVKIEPSGAAVRIEESGGGGGVEGAPELAMAYWPESGTVDSASPVLVSSGAVIDTGDIRLAKRRPCLVRLVLSCPGCSPEAKASLELRQYGPGMVQSLGFLPVAVNRPFVLRVAEPGRYYVNARTGSGPYRRQSGHLAIDLDSGRTDVVVPLYSGVRVSGTVSVPGHSGKTVPRLSIFLRPFEGTTGGGTPADVRADGEFMLDDVELREYSVGLSGLGDLIVKSVEYNGSPVKGALRLSAGAIAHSLRVVLSDRPARLTGRVNRDGAEGRFYAVMAPWPLPADTLFSEIRTAEVSDEQGRFWIEPLPPGTYRVLAVPWASQEKLHAPGVLPGLFAQASEVTLAEGDSAAVTLDLRFP